MNKNKKYAIRKLAVGVASISIGMFISNTPEVAQTLGSVGGGIIQAFDNGTENTSNETTKDWKPEGSIIAQGEDGVPWKLYENGYLLFKPEAGKDTLTNNKGKTSWKVNYGSKIKHVGFAGKVYAPVDSSSLFSINSSTVESSYDSNGDHIIGTVGHGFNPVTFDTTHLDTSKVTDMHQMFSGMSNLTKLDVTHFDTSKVTDMFGMFSGMSNLISLDVTHFDTSNVTDMSAMFSGMSKLTNLDVTHFDTSNVTDMSAMFSGMSKLTNLDVTHFDTSNVKKMNSMFEGMSNLTNLDVTKFDTSKVTNMAAMFSNVSNLTNLDVTKFDTSKVTDMNHMFYGMSKLTNLDVTHFDTSKVLWMGYMFSGMSSLTNLDVTKFDTSNVISMRWMFSEMSNLTNLDVSKFDTSKVTNMAFMFYDSSKLANLDVSKFDTSKVTNMNAMFTNLSNLTNLDVSHFNTSNVTNMGVMFGALSSLTSLDVSKWDTSKVEDMTDIFGATDKLKELKLGENFKNTTLTNNLFEHLDNHDYGNVYTNKWVKEDGSAGPFTIEEWNTAYRNDPVGMSGTWVRESTLTKYTLNFNSGTTEKITPIEVEKNTQTTLPIPKVDNTGYKFLGWSKTQDGEVITNTTNIGRPGETVTLYAKWKKVNNITKQRTPIEITTIYQGDEELFKGERNETPGQAGEKEVITTYKVTPITGELTEPTTTENIITPMRPKVIKVGTEPTADVEKIPSLVRYEKDDSREKGQENITVKGKEGRKTTISTYTVNPKTGELVETVGKPVVVEPTETVVKVAAKDKVSVEKLSSSIRYEKDGSREKGQENITVKGKDGSKTIITTYTVNPKTGEVVENVGKPVVVEPTETVVKVAAKDKIMYSKDGDNVIKETTTYNVNPKTGEITETRTREVFKENGVKDKVVVEKLPSPVRYEKDSSREKGQENITVKGKDGSKTTTTTYTVNDKTGEVVENVGKPVVVEPTETVVKVATKDKVVVVNKKDGETIKITTSYEVNPKTGELKEVKREDLLSKKGIPEVSEESTEFKGGVNPSESIVREDLPELKVAIIKDKENNVLDVIKEDEEPKEIKGYKNTGKTEVDKDGHKVYIYEKVEESKSTPKENKVENTSKEEDNKENKKEVISKKEELPKTSTSMLSTVGLFSIFGLRKNRKKDK